MEYSQKFRNILIIVIHTTAMVWKARNKTRILDA